ncbi:MAG TPA: YceI family protein [bacterium]|nr:YceI family protein [bacterium]
MRVALITVTLAAALLAPAVAAPLPGLLPAGTFEIVPGDSSAAFFVPDNRGGFSGKTTRISGRVTVVQADDAYVAQVAAAIDAGSLTTQIGLRDAAMRSTYLRTDRFPVIAFAGTASARPGLALKPFSAAIRGRLTLRDVTREEQFSATVTALSHEYLADVTTSIKMADYGIPYPRAFIFVARDPVTITLHIVARQP